MRFLIKAAIRIILIWVLLSLLITTISNFQNIHNMNNSFGVILNGYILLNIGSFIVGSAILYILWRKSDWIVKILAGDMDDRSLEINTSNADLVGLIMRILGVILLVSSIPRLLGMLGYHLYNTFGVTSSDIIQVQQYGTASEIRQWITLGVTFLFGAWLVLSASSFARVFSTIWNLGMKEPEDEGEGDKLG